jgi:tetratricopeptide (TPR) repeat protein
MRRQLGDRRSVAVSLSNIGNIEKDRGLFDEAEACYQESMQLRRAADDRYGVVMSLTQLGTLAFERGELTQARDYWEDALAEAEKIGALPLQVVLLNNLSETALNLGKFSDARRGIERAMVLANEIEDRRAYANILRNLAKVELRAGNPQMARKYGTECLEMARKGRMREMMGRAYMTLGEIYASTLFDESGPGSSAGMAEDQFRRAIKVFKDIGNEAELAKALKRLGEYQVEKGNLDGGLQNLRSATQIFDRLGMKVGEEVHKILQELAYSS